MTEVAAIKGPSSIRRVASFIANVGEGGKFTKLALFQAVPGVSQADRRMRDLRAMGWVIDNYKVNPNLLPDEYLLRTIGVRVDLGERATAARKSISGPKRRRILERDGHACQVCGTAAGAAFDDEPTRRATLSIGHIIPINRGGSDADSNLRAECQRCNDETRDLSIDPPTMEQVLAEASNIKGGVKEKKLLWQWMQAERRIPTERDRIFTNWARLPRAQRLEVVNALAAQVMKD